MTGKITFGALAFLVATAFGSAAFAACNPACKAGETCRYSNSGGKDVYQCKPNAGIMDPKNMNNNGLTGTSGGKLMQSKKVISK